MSWALLVLLVVALGAALTIASARRYELTRMQRGLEERRDARRRGSDRARLQYPHVDLSRCLGCGTCVAACPEEGVLDLLHGQAIVVHGARCVGHGRCARECPTNAISVALADVAERRDLPALTPELEAVGRRSLFLAGEVTGYALVRTAVGQGTSVANSVARRLERERGRPRGMRDLVIVGAGPAGLACSLRAKERGLSFETLERESLGGTVASYPRRKLVMTQPVALPLVGRLSRSTYEKEELIELWREAVERHALPVTTGVSFDGVVPREDGTYLVRSSVGEIATRHVCLALGRRGTPRKLGVAGEDLPKVAYSLIDARSYTDSRILVVGGGDSAVEAALGLSMQRGNEVTLSYRKHDFTRLKARNEARLLEAERGGSLRILRTSEVRSIAPDVVELGVVRNGSASTLELPNDHVFVMAGGVPPFPLLEAAGVSFDPADRPAVVPLAEQGTGLLPALAVSLAIALSALAFGAWHSEYFSLPGALRPDHPSHELLRPSGRLGLPLGIGGALAIAANLAYLARRSPRIPFTVGSLRVWMTAHVATGVLALLFVLLHASFELRDTVGGYALVSIVVLVATGSLGRYLYSFVPRAANGRELELEEIRERLVGLSAEWDRLHRGFGASVRAEVDELVARGHWSGSLPRRLRALFGARLRLRRSLARLRVRAREEGVPREQSSELATLLREVQRAALSSAHLEDLRGLLASWRWLHRWVALLLVLLVALHVFTALRYGDIL